MITLVARREKGKALVVKGEVTTYDSEGKARPSLEFSFPASLPDAASNVMSTSIDTEEFEGVDAESGRVVGEVISVSAIDENGDDVKVENLE